MGVKFKDITHPEKIEMKNLDNNVLTVDASNLIYKFLTTMRQGDGTPLRDLNGNITSHLNGILFQTATLIEQNIKPIYVFDGKAPELKQKTQQERIEVKKESEQKYQEALELGDEAKARKYAARTAHLNREIIESSKKLLTLMGIPYVQSKTEGEAQASYMANQGDAWAVVSQDYDCLLFGAPRILRNFKLTKTNTDIQLLQLQKTLDELNLTRNQLVDIAILVGTDFNDGIYGVGAKNAIKLMHKYGSLESIVKNKNYDLDCDVDEIREIFLNPDVVRNYDIEFRKPQKDKLIDFLCGEHDFDEIRTQSAIKKLQHKAAQTSLENWF